jgi:hypothetical protein
MSGAFEQYRKSGALATLYGFWRGVADTFAPINSVAVLLEASRGATRSASAPVLLADAGVENVNAQVDALNTSELNSSPPVRPAHAPLGT